MNNKEVNESTFIKKMLRYIILILSGILFITIANKLFIIFGSIFIIIGIIGCFISISQTISVINQKQYPGY